MAGFVVSPNTVRVLVHWTLHGRPQLNVLHAEYLLTGPLNPNCAQNIYASAASAMLSTGYNGVLATTTVFEGIGVIDIRGPDNPEILSTGLSVPGGGGPIALPDSTSLVLTERTALTGRAHRGRIYTLGWDNQFIMADGTADGAAAGKAVAWYQALSSAMGSESMTLAIRSTAKPDRPAHDGTTLPAKPYEITPVSVIETRDLIFDTNRRRTDQIHR